MKTNAEIIAVLHSILDAQNPNRAKLVKEFQEEVWDNKIICDNKLRDILSELAYDFDFYEPNAEWRKEASSYYDDTRLEELVKCTLQKLQEENR